MSEKLKVVTPRGELRWIFITGEGKENMSGAYKYTAQVYMTQEQAQPVIDAMDAFWEENKPGSFKKSPKSMGYKTVEQNEESTVPEADIGLVYFTMSTNTEYASGDAKVIQIRNSKNAKVSLGDKKIGNGSEGHLSGVAGIYTTLVPGSKKIQAAGVTLYLNAIMLKKFVEYIGEDPGFEPDDDDDEDGFMGVDESDFDGTDTGTTGEAPKEKPKPKL